MRLYKHTSNRQNWFQQNMANVIEACVTGRMRYQKAASQFNVPQSTLRNIIKVLVLTEQNGARHNLGKDLQQAGTDWAREFLKQHPQLFLRSPEATSTSRAMGFNRTSNGWMQGEICVNWIRHFIDLVKPTAEDPVLLLLVGQAYLKAISLAKENHVVSLCFPPYYTHRLQPFDVEFMAPLRKYYGQEIKVWLRLNRVVTQLQVAKLLDSAYAATAATAMNKFAKTGMWPLNKNVFSGVDFGLSDVIGKEQSESETADATRLEEHIAKNRQTPPLSSSVAHEIVNYKETVNDDSLPGSSNSSFTVTPKNICLVPKEQGRPKKKLAERDFLINKDSNSKESDNDDNPLCEVCHKFSSKSKKMKVESNAKVARKWYHDGCTGLPKDQLDVQLLAEAEIVTKSNSIEQAPTDDNVNPPKCSKQPETPNQVCA
ncbi:hypothetical protein ILUMI_17064 [Ignelater luminosus]|uniref:HTH psq-type domain-containing protein n=1 Tax=Ignelater luminosus TaxID=2038154 RepID=A0A8K0G7M2_IGNLU|nr:hypothetical protein ILUMI_17064 [Ignelater luminosus]